MTRLDEEDRGGLRALMSFAPYLAPHAWRLAGACLLLLLGGAGALFFPYAVRVAIDRYIVPGHARGLLGFIALVAAVMILANLATTWRVRTMAQVGQETIRRIRLDLFRHLQNLPVSFYDKTPVGRIMTRLTGDVDAMAELLSGAIVQMIGDLLMLLGLSAIMFLIDWRLALVAMAGLPPLIFVFTFLNRRIRRAEDDVREKASMVNASLQENVSGIKVIQAFWAGRQFTERFERANRDLLRSGLRAVAIFAYFWPIVDFSWVAGTGLLLFFGGRWVWQGTLTIGTLAAIMGYSGQFFGPLHGLSQAFRVVQRALAGAVRIRRILDFPPEEARTLPAMPPARGRVEFRDVSFGYDRERPILQNISFAADPGEMVALVGRTGAGKTSIINLLCRFYAPQSGRIFLDGLDINELDLESYRRQIALVLQDPFLFSGTIRENLRYGKLTATDEEMEGALAAAGLRESLDAQGMSLDTVLHERGGNLSAGQRQLLSFARAFLADPRLIILDEATAHVDTITERKVQAAMARLLAGRTSFVIAHRLSTIQAADRILLIDDGRILEQGTHQALIAARGRYWRLCCEQNALIRGEIDGPEEAAGG